MNRKKKETNSARTQHSDVWQVMRSPEVMTGQWRRLRGQAGGRTDRRTDGPTARPLRSSVVLRDLGSGIRTGGVTAAWEQSCSDTERTGSVERVQNSTQRRSTGASRAASPGRRRCVLHPGQPLARRRCASEASSSSATRATVRNHTARRALSGTGRTASPRPPARGSGPPRSRAAGAGSGTPGCRRTAGPAARAPGPHRHCRAPGCCAAAPR